MTADELRAEIATALDDVVDWARAESWGHVADALLDGPLRETLRLARIGAALEPVLDDLVTCVNYMPLLPTRRHAEATERAHLVLDEVFAERMLAAGAPVEPPQGDQT